jgi:hypothetical protein
MANRKEIVAMSLRTNIITFVLTSLTVSATPSLRQNAVLMSEQLREATIKNQMNFNEVQQFSRMDETVSNASVSNAAATQDIASSYYVLGVYADDKCSTLTLGWITPLDVCLSLHKSIYSYSSVDNAISIKQYDDSKCDVASTSTPYITVSETCYGSGSGTEYYKYSVIPSISALNTAGFLVK